MHRLRLELRQHKIWYCNFRNTLGACSPSPPSLQILPPEACYSVLPSDSVNISEAKHTYWHSDRNFKSFSILSSPLFCICLRAWKFTPPPSFKNCSFFFFFHFAAYTFHQMSPWIKIPFSSSQELNETMAVAVEHTGSFAAPPASPCFFSQGEQHSQDCI